ncbi:OmpH family outer membrane protein [Pedobacter hiemivivus]|uniref:OmpH family outer membrane protein n=1 Tax=Pedobacter hiemivivus TaxID=2530454 RepID=A0A4U1GC42_9SPHI|nr:OmpH family outer membrane protein [Pedobacter hiemivivus]TKC60293.1 OmpH family outer membrane protein [Pedobacter hiemivivus]
MNLLQNTKFFKAILFLLLLCSVGVCFLLYQHLFKNDKVAYVDSAKIFSEYKGSEKARKAYEVKANQWKANIDTLTFEVQGLMKKYEKELSGMSKKEQELSRQIIGNKRKQLSDYQRAIRENDGREQAKVNQEIVSQINAVLEDYGKKNSYKLILIANQVGTIAYAREGLDITNDVLEKLNKEYLKNK